MVGSENFAEWRLLLDQKRVSSVQRAPLQTHTVIHFPLDIRFLLLFDEIDKSQQWLIEKWIVR